MSLQNFDIAEMDCYGHIWFAVLAQAVEDATLILPKPRVHRHGVRCPRGCRRVFLTEEHYYKRTARLWFKNAEQTVGSFRWICSQLNLDGDLVIEKVRERLAETRTVRRRRKSLV